MAFVYVEFQAAGMFDREEKTNSEALRIESSRTSLPPLADVTVSGSNTRRLRLVTLTPDVIPAVVARQRRQLRDQADPGGVDVISVLVPPLAVIAAHVVAAAHVARETRRWA